LLEMTRQRLRESSVRWNLVLSIDSFALKIIRKGEELAFSNKAKIININIPVKVKAYIDKNLIKEINHFKNKYKLEFNIIADQNLIIPEYKIDLFNKNKKIIKKIENIEKIESNFTKTFYNKNNFDKKFSKNYNKKSTYNKKNKSKTKQNVITTDNKKLISS